MEEQMPITRLGSSGGTRTHVTVGGTNEGGTGPGPGGVAPKGAVVMNKNVMPMSRSDVERREEKIMRIKNRSKESMGSGGILGLEGNTGGSVSPNNANNNNNGGGVSGTNNLGSGALSGMTGGGGEKQILRINSKGGVDMSCLICMGPFTKKRPAIPMPCKGSCNKAPVHAKCIYEWSAARLKSEEAPNCPLCRGELNPVDFVQSSFLPPRSLLIEKEEARRIFVTRPLPRGAGIVRCYIRVRHVGVVTHDRIYDLYMQAPSQYPYPHGLLPDLEEPDPDDTFLMRATSVGGVFGPSVIKLSLDNDRRNKSLNSPDCMGVLRSTFMGLDYLLQSPDGAQLVGVNYNQNRYGKGVGPRKMRVAFPKIVEQSQATSPARDGSPLQNDSRGRIPSRFSSGMMSSSMIEAHMKVMTVNGEEIRKPGDGLGYRLTSKLSMHGSKHEMKARSESNFSVGDAKHARTESNFSINDPKNSPLGGAAGDGIRKGSKESISRSGEALLNRVGSKNGNGKSPRRVGSKNGKSPKRGLRSPSSPNGSDFGSMVSADSLDSDDKGVLDGYIEVDDDEDELDPDDTTWVTWDYRPTKKSESLSAFAKGGIQAIRTSKLKHYFAFNKIPVWNEEAQVHSLDFHGRVTLPSNKSFQMLVLGEPNDDDMFHLQFGKVADEEFVTVYTMDLQWPFSILQAFGICVSACDPKIACA